MCCSLISKNSAVKILDPLIITNIKLAKTQTFVPILGVIPAVLAIITGLVTTIIAIAMRCFSDPIALETCEEGAELSLLLVGYSIINIASVGMFSPILEYVTEFLSKGGEEKTSTAGFFDIFPTLGKGKQIIFI